MFITTELISGPRNVKCFICVDGIGYLINHLVDMKTVVASCIIIFDDTLVQVFSHTGLEKVLHDFYFIKGEEKSMFHESTTRIFVFSLNIDGC